MDYIPYFLNEIHVVFRNTPIYALVFEIFLFLSLIWLLIPKGLRCKSAKIYTKDEEEDIINNYKPEPLVPETVNEDHPLLQHRLVEGMVGKYVQVDGNKCLNLATHNYLGLIENPTILKHACESLHKYGVGSCGPRGFYGTMDVHLELEERLAKFMRMEEAAVYSYAFSTVASAIPAYSKRGDVIFVDEAVNFAIQKGLDASRSRIYYFKHNNMIDLERILKEQAARDAKNPKQALRIRRFLVAEGIYMNTGEICPLDELIILRAKYKLRLILDESISFGVLGRGGRGLTEHLNVDINEVDLITSSLEAAVASIGGFCVGSHFIVEHQRLSGLGYCFSASLPPCLAQAAISALNRFEHQPQMFEELQNICHFVHEIFSNFSKLVLRGSKASPVKHLYLRTPLEQSEHERQKLTEVADKCIENGIAVIAASYLYDLEKHPIRPSLRITVNRLLTTDDINHAFHILETITNSLI